MKKMFLLITFLICSFIFISKPKAELTSATLYIDTQQVVSDKWIKPSIETTYNITANASFDSLGVYVVRFQVCLRSPDSFIINPYSGEKKSISYNVTNEICTFSNGYSVGNLWNIDVTFETWNGIGSGNHTYGIAENIVFYSTTYKTVSIELHKIIPLSQSDLIIIDGLDNLNKNQQQTNEKLDNIDNTIKDDDIDTSGSNSFFNDFDTKDHGGLSSIITSPLKAYSKITQKCTPINMTVLDKEITLPCGDTLFWNKSEVSSFKIIWNILLGGPILYALLVKLFKTIEGLKNPDDDRIEVAKL